MAERCARRVGPLTLTLSRKGRGDTSVCGAKVRVQTIGSTSVAMPKHRTRHTHLGSPLTLTLSREGRGDTSDFVAKRIHIKQISAPPLPLWERAGVRGFLRPINAKRRRDLRQRAFGIGENLVVPKPEHPKAILLQTHRSLGVPCRAALTCVLAAVEFDDEFGVEAAKICDIGTDGNLSAEFEAFKAPVTQQRPQAALGVGLIFSEETRACYAHEVCPLTLALSHEGRGNYAPGSAVSVQTTDIAVNRVPIPYAPISARFQRRPLSPRGRGPG